VCRRAHRALLPSRMFGGSHGGVKQCQEKVSLNQMTHAAQRPMSASTQAHVSPEPPTPLTPASEGLEEGETEAFYLHAKVFATLQRAATRQGAADWRVYAHQRLDAALAAHALLLDPAQADAVRQYAQALDMAPEEVLTQLLAPEMVRRERRQRQVVSFVKRHHPRPPRGCLVPLVWGLGLLFTCSVGLIVVWLGVVLLHTLH